MNRVRRAIPFVCLVIWDIISAILSLYIAVKIRFPYSNEATAAVFVNLSAYYLFLTASLVFISILFGCYTSVLRHVGFKDAIRQFVAVLIAVGAVYILDITETVNILLSNNSFSYDIGIYLITFGFLYLLSIFGRSFIKLLSSLKSKLAGITDTNYKRVLIYGAGEAGVFLHTKMDNHPDDRFRPIVFIDDNENFIRRRVNGLKVYGNGSKLKEAIIKYNIDLVIVAIPTATRELLQNVVDVCKECKCKIQRFGTIDNVDLSNAAITNINYEDLLRRDRVDLDMDAVNSFIKDKVVLVTGGAGSIGSEICRQVLKYECKKLIVFDFNENGLFYINNELLEAFDSDRFVMRLGSIRDTDRLNEVFDEFNPQVVFHAAAHKHVPMSEINPREVIKNNIFGTLKTAVVAGKHNVEKFILISTDKAVNPTNIMGASKRVAELVIRSLNDTFTTDYAAVRFGNVLGSNGSVVPFFQKQINAGGPVTVTHPDMRRYFMTIPEAVQLVLEAGAMANGSEVFVLDMGKPVKIYDLACDLIRLSGYEPNVDIMIEFTGLRPGEKMFEEISVKGEKFDATANDKIVILKPDENDLDNLDSHLNELEKAVEDETSQSLYKIVKKAVPTFKHKYLD